MNDHERAQLEAEYARAVASETSEGMLADRRALLVAHLEEWGAQVENGRATALPAFVTGERRQLVLGATRDLEAIAERLTELKKESN